MNIMFSYVLQHYEERGDGHRTNQVFSYHRRSGLVGESKHLRVIYLGHTLNHCFVTQTCVIWILLFVHSLLVRYRTCNQCEMISRSQIMPTPICLEMFGAYMDIFNEIKVKIPHILLSVKLNWGLSCPTSNSQSSRFIISSFKIKVEMQKLQQLKITSSFSLSDHKGLLNCVIKIEPRMIDRLWAHSPISS